MCYPRKMADLPDHAKQWRSTAAIFRKLAESIHPTEWTPTVPLTGTAFPDEDQRHAARQAMLATYPPVLQECLDVTVRWFADPERKLPDQISQPARYWTHRMAIQISEFCAAHVCRLTGSLETIIPYSNKKQIEVCDWLIAEWWSNVGLKRFVE
jgi:hypothetical protein